MKKNHAMQLPQMTIEELQTFSEALVRMNNRRIGNDFRVAEVEDNTKMKTRLDEVFSAVDVLLIYVAESSVLELYRQQFPVEEIAHQLGMTLDEVKEVIAKYC